MRSTQALSGLLLLMVLVCPAIAMACPVCGTGTAENQGAFLNMTIFMSLLPLALIGGTTFWLWRRSRAQDTSPQDPSLQPGLSRSSG